MRRRVFGAALVGLGLGGAGGLAAILGVGPSDARAEPPKEGWPPDPAPIATKKQWIFEIRAAESIPSVVKVSSLELDKNEPTARVMGRWALEFYVGTEILDRLRFNVPLAGDATGEKPGPGKKRPEFRVNTKFFLRMADNPRTTIVRLVDRATGDIKLFAWPPGKDGKLVPWVSTAAASASASASASAAPDAGPPDAAPPSDGGAAKDGGFKPDGI